MQSWEVVTWASETEGCSLRAGLGLLTWARYLFCPCLSFAPLNPFYFYDPLTSFLCHGDIQTDQATPWHFTEFILRLHYSGLNLFSYCSAYMCVYTCACVSILSCWTVIFLKAETRYYNSFYAKYMVGAQYCHWESRVLQVKKAFFLWELWSGLWSFSVSCGCR